MITIAFVIIPMIQIVEILVFSDGTEKVVAVKDIQEGEGLTCDYKRNHSIFDYKMSIH